MPRWVRIAKWTAAGFVLLVFTAVLAVFGYANSGAGQARIRQALIGALQPSFEGKLSVGRIEWLGATAVLHDVTLTDPSGAKVASIEQVDAHVSFPALLSHTLRITTLEIVGPHLAVVVTPEGSNLARALQRPPAKKPAKERGGRPLALQIDSIVVREGELSLEQRLPQAERTFRATGLGGRGSGRFSPGSRAASADLLLQAQLTAPVSGPLRIELSSHPQDAQQFVDLRVQVAGAELAAKAWLLGPSQRIALEELRVTPETGRAFLPSWPLQEPLVASGEAQLENERASLRLAARVGDTKSTLLGRVGLSGAHAFAVTLTAHDVDLAQLALRAPRSKLELHLRAEGTAPRITDVDGVVTAEVPEGRLDGDPAGPFALRLVAHEGAFELTELHGKLPGVLLDAHGRASATRLELAGEAQISDLSQLQRMFARTSPALRTPLAGSGVVRFRVQGPRSQPGLELKARFPRLARAGMAATGLSLSADAPGGIRGPLAAHVQADRVKLGTRNFRGVSADAHLSARSFDAKAQLQSLRLATRGERLGPSRLRVLALSLGLPHETFTLRSPATVTLRQGSLSLTPLALDSGQQTIALAGRFGGSLDGSLDVTRLDLARLSLPDFVNAPVVAGTLDLHARVRGTRAQPRLETKLELSRGRVADLAPIDLAAIAHYDGRRAEGQARLASPPAALDARFDLPLEALHKGSPERVSALVQLHRLSLGALTRALHLAHPLAGELQGQLALSGSGADPRLALNVAGRNLALLPDTPALSLHLGAHTPRQGGLFAKLELATAASHGTVTATTAARLGTLLQSHVRALHLPFSVHAHLGDLPLASLALRTNQGVPITGALSISADLSGTPAEPRGHLDSVLKNLELGPLQPVFAELHLSATDRGIDGRLDASRGHASLAHVRARLKSPPELLARDGHDLMDVPLSLSAHLGPVQPQDLQWARGQQLVAQGKLSATVEANLEASGTLRRPIVSLQTRLEQMQVKGAPETHGLLSVRYSERHLSGQLALKTVHHGELDARLDSEVDLSAPALSRLKLADAPTHALLAFEDFRPDFLVDLLPNVSDLRGRIDGHARLDGTLAQPELAGKIEWSDGVLGVKGLGVFDPVHLIAAFDGHEIRVAPLTVSRGQGRAELLAVADLGRVVSLQGRFDAEQLMITTGYEDRGKLTTAARFDGTLRDGQLTLDVRTERVTQLELPRRQPETVANLGMPFGVRIVSSEDELNRPLHAPSLQQPGARGARARGALPSPRMDHGLFRSPAHPQATSTMRLNIRLHAPEGIAVRSDTLDVHLNVSEPFRLVYQGEPLIFGEALLDRGKVAFLGQHVDAVAGTRVRFGGPFAAGYVEVSAQRVPPAPGTERALIAGTGTGGSGPVQLHPFGQEMNELELYQLLATGHLTLSPAGPTGKPPAFVGAFEKSLAEQLVSSKIPLNLFGIEAGTPPFATASMQTGTWFSDRIFVAYSSELVADPTQGENATSVALQYDLGPRWQVELLYGDADEGQANLVWHQRF